MEINCVESHDKFRLFISAEPAPSAEYHIIPQGILESAIKITNEPPTGMYANLHKALDNFSQVCRRLTVSAAFCKITTLCGENVALIGPYNYLYRHCISNSYKDCNFRLSTCRNAEAPRRKPTTPPFFN
jgi:hypothetical protein